MHACARARMHTRMQVRSFATFESAMLALFFMLIGRASTSQELAAYSDESGNPLAVHMHVCSYT